jgi:ribosomal protein S13
MALLGKIFQDPGALTTEWNAYVQEGIDKLVSKEPPRGGIRHKRSWKKRGNKIRHGRRTYRKRP